MHSTHYAGSDLIMKFNPGEPWKKLFGPVFIHLNSLPNKTHDPYKTLWDDANKQMMKEVEIWPYDFVASEDYPTSAQRGSVRGTLLLQLG